MRDLVPVILGLLVVCGLCLWGSARQLRRRRILGDTPTSKAQGVFIGFVELKGTAESAQPLTSFLAETACVHYAWQVDEHWSRVVTESYTDSKGNRQTRTRVESGWTTVAEGGETIPFYLRDESLNDAFLAGAKQRGLLQLKGHKSVGGMRASIYNAMPIEGVQALVDYLNEFAGR